MKFWLVACAGLVGIYTMVQLAKRNMTGLASWVGFCLLTVVGNVCFTRGYENGAQAMEKGWVVRHEDTGMLYPTDTNPFIEAVRNSPKGK